MNEIKRQPIEGLQPYENKWVAIDETEAERTVVGRGDAAANFVFIKKAVSRQLSAISQKVNAEG